MAGQSAAFADTTGRPTNRLLAALPAPDFNRIADRLRVIPVRPRQVLQAAGEPVRYVYFPNGGVFSITTVLPDGTIVEAAMVRANCR